MKKTLKMFLALLLALVMILGLAACGNNPNDPGTQNPGTQDPGTQDPGTQDPGTGDPGNTDSRYGGVLDLVWMGCNDHLDCHYSTGWNSYFWGQNVYETPLSRDASGRVCPNVCEYELSDDGLVLKLWVRDGITFHDGSPVEIEDVVASLERAGRMVKNLSNYFAGLTESCEVSNGVATYTFTSYTPNTLYYISGDQNWSGILPKEICEKYPDSPINVVEDAIGTGPYYVDSYESNVVYRLKRYDGYVPVPEGNTGMAAPKMAYMDAMNIWINKDSTSIAMAILAGDYDIYTINDSYDEVAPSYGLTTWLDSQQNMLTCYFNTRGDRPVNNVDLRRAIAAALDFQAMLDVEYPNYVMDSNPMKGDVYATDVFESADWYGAANIELSKHYQELAGYNGEEIVILIDRGNVCVMQTLMEAQLEAAGINVKLEYMDSSSVAEYYGDPSNPFDMFVQTFTASSYSPAVISATVRNTFWGNERKDQLFAGIQASVPGSAESVKLWKELSELWVEDCAVVNVATIMYKWTLPETLHPNCEGGTWHYFWNAYWDNPSEHMD